MKCRLQNGSDEIIELILEVIYMHINEHRKNMFTFSPLLSFSSFHFSPFSFPSLSSQDLKTLMQHGVEEGAGKGMTPPKVGIYQVKKDHEVAMAKSHQAIHQIRS